MEDKIQIIKWVPYEEAFLLYDDLYVLCEEMQKRYKKALIDCLKENMLNCIGHICSNRLVPIMSGGISLFFSMREWNSIKSECYGVKRC